MILAFAPVAILGILLVGFIGGEVVRLLWNWLMPSLFGLREVTFWEALGLLALCRILFGGHGFCRSRSRSRTPEERERFRQAVRARFGHDPSTSDRVGHDAPAPLR